MWTHRIFRALFPKFESRSVTVATLGRLTSNRFGYWVLDEAVCLAGHPVEVAFQTAGVTPDAADIARYWEVEFYWPQIWQSVLSKLGNELEDDGADGERSDFLAKARPRYLEFFGTAAECEWELVLEPEIYGGHIVTMRMAHHQCYDFRLDG